MNILDHEKPHPKEHMETAYIIIETKNFGTQKTDISNKQHTSYRPSNSALKEMWRLGATSEFSRFRVFLFV